MAAGLGFKTFATGDVLSAADTNGYLMQGVLVFASAAARDSAITSPQEGQFAYLKDTNVTTYYTGSAWANLDTTGMTNPMTTTGDTIYSSSGSTPARLGIGSTGQVLTVAAGIPSWSTPAGSSFAGVQLQNATGNISVANATGVTLTWASEKYDVGGYHTGSSSDIVIPSGKAGYYLITFNFTFSANATGQRIGYIAFGGGSDNAATTLQATSAEELQAGISIVRYCAVADTISGIVYQNSGSTLSIRSAATSANYAGNSTSLTAIFLGA